jgi:hypothetical protein
MKNTFNILVEKPEGRSYLEDLHENGRIILKWILKIMCDGVDWIRLAQNRV